MNITAKRKKKLTIALSVLLVTVIAIGITLAYLFSKTDPVSNVFTFAENIKGALDEPSWNPDDAMNLVPGKEIPKDPQITNTSENGVTEYAAVKLTFLDGAGNAITAPNMVKLLNLIDIDWSNNWTLAAGTLTKDGTAVTAASAEQIYVFNETLPQGITSDPVFYSVTIPGSITSEELLWLLGDYGHGDACYTAGAHDGSVCTITYRHHEKCAIYGMTGADTVAAGGMLDAVVCNCSATEIHNTKCPSLIKTLAGECSHTEIIAGLGNFTIKVEGAVVQADTFDALFSPVPPVAGEAYASDALITLFNPQP